MDKLTFKPSEAITKKFKVVNTTTPLIHFGGSVVDLRVVTLEEAEQLVADGIGYLEKVGK
jgi:hypothetical protein